jgi:hypothetical protein
VCVCIYVQGELEHECSSLVMSNFRNVFHCAAVLGATDLVKALAQALATVNPAQLERLLCMMTTSFQLPINVALENGHLACAQAFMECYRLAGCVPKLYADEDLCSRTRLLASKIDLTSWQERQLQTVTADKVEFPLFASVVKLCRLLSLNGGGDGANDRPNPVSLAVRNSFRLDSVHHTFAPQPGGTSCGEKDKVAPVDYGAMGKALDDVMEVLCWQMASGLDVRTALSNGPAVEAKLNALFRSPHNQGFGRSVGVDSFGIRRLLAPVPNLGTKPANAEEPEVWTVISFLEAVQARLVTSVQSMKKAMEFLDALEASRGTFEPEPVT